MLILYFMRKLFNITPVSLSVSIVHIQYINTCTCTCISVPTCYNN